jgi:hypothetical protein
MKIEYCCESIRHAINKSLFFFDFNGLTMKRMDVPRCPWCGAEIKVTSAEDEED